APPIRDSGQRSEHLAEGHCLRACDDELAIRSLLYRARSQECLGNIGHVHHVAATIAAPEQRKATLRNRTEQLYESLIARPVHGGRAQDHVLHPMLRAQPPHLRLRGSFATLVAVPGMYRRALVDQGLRALPVNSRRTAVNETTYACLRGGSKHVRRARNVHTLEV